MSSSKLTLLFVDSLCWWFAFWFGVCLEFFFFIFVWFLKLDDYLYPDITGTYPKQNLFMSVHEHKGNDVCLLLCKNGVGKFGVLKVFEP